jgi:hypothetical protein
MAGYMLDVDERIDPPPLITCLDVLHGVRLSLDQIDVTQPSFTLEEMYAICNRANLVWTYSTWMVKHGYMGFEEVASVASDHVLFHWKTISDVGL